MSAKKLIALDLAHALIHGPWNLRAMAQRVARVLRRRYRWMTAFVRRVKQSFPAAPNSLSRLASWIAVDKDFVGHWEYFPLPRIHRWSMPVMAPSPWTVPPLATVGALADWLELTPRELDWFADCQGREASHPCGPLRHYTYKALPKRGGRFRLIESPKFRLQKIQRRILDEILSVISPHDAAHGFRRGRSVLSFAGTHANKSVVLRLDLADFFPSVQASRVHALFRTAGYPAAVARLLTGLCTNATPRDALPAAIEATDLGWRLQKRFSSPHLPQGAPTSPALANLCAYRLDLRLTKLAQSVGATYTRYAEDLAFSGNRDLSRGVLRIYEKACQIVVEEGFAVRPAKTRIMRQGVRQQLAGVVVNQRVNVSRREFDLLKAILHNAIQNGPGSENRERRPNFREHLLGRIAWISSLNAERGKKLRGMFERIAWET